MLRNASRRLSTLQPVVDFELPLTGQGGSSLLLVANLRIWSTCSSPYLAAAPSNTAAAAAAAGTLALVSAPQQQPGSSRSYSSHSSSNIRRPSSTGDLKHSPAGGGVLRPSRATTACTSSIPEHRSLHWGSAAAAAAAKQQRRPAAAATAGDASFEEQQRTADALDSATRSLMPGTALSKYLQDRLGVLADEADAVVKRIQTRSSAKAQSSRRRQQPEALLAEWMPVVDFLADEIGGADAAALLRAHPETLLETPIDHMRQNCQQLTQELQFSRQELALLFKKGPFLLRVDLRRNVLPMCALLRDWGLSQSELHRVAVSRSSLFLYRKDAVEDRILWLHEQLGLSRKQIEAVLSKYVLVAVYSESQFEQGRQWLLKQGLSPSQLPRVVARFPHILVYSEKKRQEWLTFMREELGLSQAAVARILVAQPDMAGRSMGLLRKHLQMWQHVLRLTPTQLHSMLEANASILRLDVSSPTYATKIDYLLHLLEGNDQTVARVLANHPFYLSYRLERIVTRAEYLRANGRLNAESPTSWLSCSEPLFAVQFAKSNPADFAAFRQQFLTSPDAKRLLGTAAQERAQRMTSRRLEHERASDAAMLAGIEGSLRHRLQELEEREARLAAAEKMLQQREEAAAAAAEQQPAAGNGAALAGLQQRQAVQQAKLEQQVERKLPRLDGTLPNFDFSGEEWTAAAVRRRRVSLVQRIQALRQTLHEMAPAPMQQQQQAADASA